MKSTSTFYEILVNDTFSTQIARFEFATFSSSRNMILKRFGAMKAKSTFHVRFFSMISFLTKSRVSNPLHSVVAENIILRLFGAMMSRSTFHVRFFSMISFPAKSRVSNPLHSVVAENIILKRFGAIK